MKTTSKNKSKKQRNTRSGNVCDIATSDLSREFDGGILNEDFLDTEAMAMVDEEVDIIYY